MKKLLRSMKEMFKELLNPHGRYSAKRFAGFYCFGMSGVMAVIIMIPPLDIAYAEVFPFFTAFLTAGLSLLVAGLGDKKKEGQSDRK